MDADTIVAMATPPGEGAVALLRLSGPRAVDIAKSVFRAGAGWEGRPRRVTVGRIVVGGRQLDSGLAWVMPAPHSYTGEDIVEISCHGSMAVAEEVIRSALEAGARLAERGEFTRRAFLNGKLDLVQAEAVIELVQAADRPAARRACGALTGGLSSRVQALRDRTQEFRAQLEVRLDFPEDELTALEMPGLCEAAGGLAAQAEALAATYEGVRRRAGGQTVVLLGRPNAGKSTLLNALLGEDRAIVAELPGTTRDLVEGRVWWSGQAVRLIDTAGVREDGDAVERAGVQRALAASAAADAVVVVVDGAGEWTREDGELVRRVASRPAVVAVTKVDLGRRLRLPDGTGLAEVEVSGLTGLGLERLAAAVRACLPAPAEDEIGLLRQRHQLCLAAAGAALRGAQTGLADGAAIECCAVEAGEAVRALDELLGVGVGDEILDVIFRDFCIGK